MEGSRFGSLKSAEEGAAGIDYSPKYKIQNGV